ncbi:MAG: hypothetical protein SVV03_02970 [Candidatus Nanohaloarchaea archaeon]|nr:hypothetical protein [Candidatus Nanohaloarchaea archaeon]
MNRKILLMFVATTLLTAGCIGGGGNNQPQPNVPTFTQTDGLSIDFDSAASSYYTGDRATFIVEMQNTGEADAWLRQVKLYKAAWIDQPFIFTGDKVRLSGVDRNNNLPGRSRTFTANPRIDVSLETGSSYTYDVGLRVKYDYTTDARSKFTVVPFKRFRGEEDEEPARRPISTSYTGGPMKVEVNANEPLPAEAGIVTLPITITNMGDGRLAENANGREALGPGSFIQLEAGDAQIRGCELEGGNLVMYDDQKQIFCTIDIGKAAINTPTDLVLKTHLEYTYVEDKQTQIEVKSTGR